MPPTGREHSDQSIGSKRGPLPPYAQMPPSAGEESVRRILSPAGLPEGTKSALLRGARRADGVGLLPAPGERRFREREQRRGPPEGSQHSCKRYSKPERHNPEV